MVVIKNRHESAPDQDKRFDEIRKNKEKWENIYEKYKEKYQQSNFDFSSPGAKSTPKIPEAFNKMTEKSSQTSMKRISAKSTQVEVLSIRRSSKECQVTSDKGSLSSKHSNELTDIYQNQSEVAESFEFIAGSMNHPQKRNESSSPESSSVKSDTTKNEPSHVSSRKNSESSLKNEDISNFDDSLKVAIQLLNSLLESRQMKPELKRNLAGKVIQKIIQIQTSRSIQTSTFGSSGIYPLSNSSRAPSEAVKSEKEASIKDSSVKDSSAKESSKSSGKSREDVLKDCLKPMTQSELNYHQSTYDEPTRSSTNSKSVPKSQLMDYVKREKQSHLMWIEKEIEHLRNLRDLLKRNETPISIEENCLIYANLSSLLEKEKEIGVAEKIPEKPPVAAPSAPVTNVWNSHANNKKVSSSRSKLETPELPAPSQSHEESLASFIDNKNRKFMEKYEKSQKEIYEDVNVYTRPYSESRKLPEAPRIVKHKTGSKRTPLTTTKDVQTSTSLASSSVFESSDSISVPVNTNTKTSTTHYQSETFGNKDKKSSSSRIKQRIAETQTTDSICRTQPIFEAKKKPADAQFGTTSTTVTQRINRMRNDKQQQTHPPSIKYTLSFDKKCRANVRQYMSLPQQENSEYAAITKISKEIYNTATWDSRHSEDKENYVADTLINDDDDVDLQSCLNKRRPDIFTRVEERKRCITELKKLR